MIDRLKARVAEYVADVCGPALAKVHARLAAQRLRMDVLEKRLDAEREAHLQTRAALCVLAGRIGELEDARGEIVYTSVEAGS